MLGFGHCYRLAVKKRNGEKQVPAKLADAIKHRLSNLQVINYLPRLSALAPLRTLIFRRSSLLEGSISGPLTSLWLSDF